MKPKATAILLIIEGASEERKFFIYFAFNELKRL
jgi:hypothetical protein